jgi:hypothetical protein
MENKSPSDLKNFWKLQQIAGGILIIFAIAIGSHDLYIQHYRFAGMMGVCAIVIAGLIAFGPKMRRAL